MSEVSAPRRSPYYRRTHLHAAILYGAEYAIRKAHLREETDAMLLGTLAHRAVLLDEDVRMHMMPTGQVRRAPGQECLSRADTDKLAGIVDSARRGLNRVIALSCDQCVREQTIEREHDGRAYMATPDAMLKVADDLTIIADLKISGRIDRRSFGRSTRDYGYWHQACLYAWACNSPAVNWHTVAVSDEPPHDVAIYSHVFAPGVFDDQTTVEADTLAQMFDAAKEIDWAVDGDKRGMLRNGVDPYCFDYPLEAPFFTRAVADADVKIDEEEEAAK